MPCIDFALMRRRVGAMTGDILEEIAKMAPEAQARARAAIWDVEQQVTVALVPAIIWTCQRDVLAHPVALARLRLTA